MHAWTRVARVGAKHLDGHTSMDLRLASHPPSLVERPEHNRSGRRIRVGSTIVDGYFGMHSVERCVRGVNYSRGDGVFCHLQSLTLLVRILSFPLSAGRSGRSSLLGHG